MLARVSNIESFRRWREDEDQSLEDLINFITKDEPTEAMKAGTAFHKAMELAGEGDHGSFEANGYTFLLPDAELALPRVREMRAYGMYGGLNVTGQVDAVEGKIVTDHKTTAKFDPERYLDGCQWKFYLDLFGADEFRWNIFTIREVEPLTYSVAAPQFLTAYRYPEMHDYCVSLAADYLGFANTHLVDPDASIRRERADILRNELVRSVLAG